ncbi:hypothetical protein ES332_A05G245500v1 [Gossypium tomentosum]|uniref:Uncharacterized protein n=1 Tax=Gossypium tomentosum TaxID=34277 RepID=A0A5D2QJ83_GOSTO|nr:hypothetical protein ES332_A05G245500v1 [Gossypium tomentosum]
MLASATPNKSRDSLSNSKHAPTLQTFPTTFSLFQQLTEVTSAATLIPYHYNAPT